VYSKISSFKRHIIVLILILFVCVSSSILSFLSTINYWIRLLTILIYIRGIIVLFIFVVSLAPNDQYKVKNISKNFFFIGLCLIVSAGAIFSSSIRFKIGSSYKINNFYTFFIVGLIFLISLLPPKIIILIYKGIKSSK